MLFWFRCILYSSYVAVLLENDIFNADFGSVAYYIQVMSLFYWKTIFSMLILVPWFRCILYSSYVAVLLENDIFTFWGWILVIGRSAIMFRFGTIFCPLL